MYANELGPWSAGRERGRGRLWRRSFIGSGVLEQTFYRWRKVYCGLAVGEWRRVKPFEEENRKLQHLPADLSVYKQLLQDMVAKKF